MNIAAQASDQVDYIDGKTRLYGIVGDPIEQVRSPEMVTWEMRERGMNAVLVPVHVREADFDRTLAGVMNIANLDGLIFTIPYKARALSLAARLGAQASVVGALNALRRDPDGRWCGEMFDGLGCVEGLRRNGVDLNGRRVMLLGLGGAGSAIAAAVASQHPALMRLHDPDPARLARGVQIVSQISPGTVVKQGLPRVDSIDVLINASPIGMLGDERLPVPLDQLPASLTVLDAIVKPETTPLLALAERCGCRVVRGREMMRGQISRIVDFMTGTDPNAT
jgi:shikimate dehydrogenase